MGQVALVRGASAAAPVPVGPVDHAQEPPRTGLAELVARRPRRAPGRCAGVSLRLRHPAVRRVVRQPALDDRVRAQDAGHPMRRRARRPRPGRRPPGPARRSPGGPVPRSTSSGPRDRVVRREQGSGAREQVPAAAGASLRATALSGGRGRGVGPPGGRARVAVLVGDPEVRLLAVSLLEVVADDLLDLAEPIAGGLLDPAGEPLVEVGTARLRERRVRGVADQDVPELELAGRSVGCLLGEPASDELRAGPASRDGRDRGRALRPGDSTTTEARSKTRPMTEARSATARTSRARDDRDARSGGR